ncbi:helix-turn-helix transcriptional regulator [Hoeflea ulvae]|uniref:helix-turn-helix transcriptional regulator n=1 Tax=Hoeflea ulvae TaxID=2983764 RepID=UPI003CCCEDA8
MIGDTSKMSESTRTEPILVGTKEAARLLGLSSSTLEKWRFFRVAGTPPVVRIGRACRYRLDDLRTWVDQASNPE